MEGLIDSIEEWDKNQCESRGYKRRKTHSSAVRSIEDPIYISD